MIKVSVDEGYAFDMLAIAKVKCDKQQNNDRKAHANYNRLKYEIWDQVDNLVEILISPEYVELYNVNWKLYELVDKAKRNEVTAKEVDDGVYLRYKAKKALQEKFFSEIPLTEQKFGYSN